jgi:plasmid stabilization system protein ParE
MDGLLRRVERLRELPEQGRIVPEWEEERIREVFHGSYRILYEVVEDRIEILTLSHMRQELSLSPGR